MADYSLCWKSVHEINKDVHANCLCASVMRTKIHMPLLALMCVLSNKMNNDVHMAGHMAIATPLPRFNDLGTFNDSYSSFDGSFSLPVFYV